MTLEILTAIYAVDQNVVTDNIVMPHLLQISKLR